MDQFFFFDGYLIWFSLINNSYSFVRFMDIYKIEIPDFNWLYIEFIEHLLSVFGI